MDVSKLLSNAFTIYSMAYSKIGQMGVDVVDLAGKPRQPKKWKQLVEATRLFRVIEPSIVLNDNGDAITWVHGDVEVINNLLLKLKQKCDLFDNNVFATPLTTLVIEQSCQCDGGSGEGGCPDVEQVDTSGESITLDLDGECKKLFRGLADIDEAKVWVIEGDSGATEFLFVFGITGLTPGDSTHDQTMPSNVKMSDARVVSSSPKKWRPYANGEYLARATTFDGGLNWRLEISNDVYT